MPSILALPPELLESVLELCESTDVKEFRCVSRECAEHATPLLFRELSFDLDSDGSNGLLFVAQTPRLRQHVQTLHLERRNGLKNFSDFDSWRSATIYEHIPVLEQEEVIQLSESVRTTSQTLSQAEWEALSEHEVRQMYASYQLDEEQRDAYAVRLAYALSSIVTPQYCTASRLQGWSPDAQVTLQRFSSGIGLLTNVRDLTYTPAYEDEDQWGRSWQNIEFHPEGLVLHGSFGVDPDIDSLQLYFVLRTTLRGRNSLEFAEVFTGGHAFWSSAHLRRLLDWNTTPSLHSHPHDELVDEALERWTHEVGGPLQVIHYTEPLTRDLVMVERAFYRLSRLECRVETIWSDGPNERETIALALSRMLKEATKLQRLDLIFRDHAGNDEHGEHFFFDVRLQVQAHGAEKVQQSVKVSQHLLLAASHLKQLRQLHLSFATPAEYLRRLLANLKYLRKLRLTYVALLSKDCDCENLFGWIAQHCRLDSLELRSLEDVHLRQPRLILNSEDPIWHTEAATAHTYELYEREIVRFGLRKSATLPPLSPRDFLKAVLGQYS